MNAVNLFKDTFAVVLNFPSLYYIEFFFRKMPNKNQFEVFQKFVFHRASPGVLLDFGAMIA